MGMRGFFQGSTLTGSKGFQSTVPRCGACGLYKHCESPKMAVAGEGARRILIVSESPGKEEDEDGKQFVGQGAKFVAEALKRAGVDMRRDCWLTSALICYPTKEPPKTAVDDCRANIIDTINRLKPTHILLMGQMAVKSVIGWLWSEDVGAVSRWVGFCIPLQKINAWVMPVMNPFFVMREDEKDRGKSVAKKLFQRHVKELVSHEGRPFRKDAIPDRKSKVELLFDPDEAVKRIRAITKRGGVTAFDYEANMLKPDSKQFRLLSCSICDGGEYTIAFQTVPRVQEALREYLVSDCRKIASNLKYEDRVSRRVFGTRVCGWTWDTMLAAHAIDSRPGICSIKFQGFVLLGEDKYNDHIEKFLQSGGSNTPNQAAEEISLDHLLEYNGMDSQIEYDVAEVQAQILGDEL